MLTNRVHFDNSFRYDPKSYEHILLYQVGDLICEGDYDIGEHQQYCYEISYIVSGKGDYFTNGKSYSLEKGDVYLGITGQYHNGIADKFEPFRYFYLGFAFEENIDQDISFSKIKKMFDQVENPVCKDKFNIYEPFIGIFNEIINGRDFSNMMIRINMYKIILLAYRDFFESKGSEYSFEYRNDSSKIIIFNIINYIDTNLGNISELSQIASSLGYSYPYLSRVFTSETGSTIQDYYDKKRFEKAIELLENSNFNVTRISEYLGYQSIHSFSRAFHKRFGISPTEWQHHKEYKNHIVIK
jgi:AraC-like DNA-binding protein